MVIDTQQLFEYDSILDFHPFRIKNRWMIKIYPRGFPFLLHDIACQEETILLSEWKNANRSR